MFPEVVETDRLRLERVSRETVDPFELYEACHEDAPDIEEVTRYVTWEPYETLRDAQAFLDVAESDFESGDGVHYAVRPREGEDGAGEFAGATGLSVDWDCRVAEPGIWLRKRFWGRGYSGERAAALLAVAFDDLDLEVVRIPVHHGNEKSLSAVADYVERFGGRRDGTVRNYHYLEGSGPADMVVFSIASEEYESATVEGR